MRMYIRIWHFPITVQKFVPYESQSTLEFTHEWKFLRFQSESAIGLWLVDSTMWEDFELWVLTAYALC